MSSPARKSASVALLVVLLTGLAWWFTTSKESVPPDPVTDAGPLAASASPGPALAPTRENVESLPLAFEGLRLRAEAGESRVACQLGAKLIYCASIQRFLDRDLQEWVAKSEHILAQEGQLDQANRYAQMQLLAISARRECVGLPAQAGRMGHAWMRRAALAGEPEAMLLHASGETLVTSFEDGWSFLQDERFKQWRAEAPAMLQSLLEQGDPAALIALLHGYANRQYLGWITVPDPDRALTLSLLAQEVFSRPGDLPSAGYSFDLREPDQRRRYRDAMLQAREWHRQYFDGRKHETEPHLQRLEGPAGMGDSEFDPPSICGAEWGKQ